jgi:hypothetical protein
MVRSPKMSKLLVLEIIGLLILVVGIAMLSVPVALMVLGVAVVAACEVRGGEDGRT